MRGRVAQLDRVPATNQAVGGSNPPASAIFETHIEYKDTNLSEVHSFKRRPATAIFETHIEYKDKIIARL